MFWEWKRGIYRIENFGIFQNPQRVIFWMPKRFKTFIIPFLKFVFQSKNKSAFFFFWSSEYLGRTMCKKAQCWASDVTYGIVMASLGTNYYSFSKCFWNGCLYKLEHGFAAWSSHYRQKGLTLPIKYSSEANAHYGPEIQTTQNVYLFNQIQTSWKIITK